MAKKEEEHLCHKDKNGNWVCEPRTKKSPLYLKGATKTPLACHVDEQGNEVCQVVPKKKARKTKKGKKGKKRAKACS